MELLIISYTSDNFIKANFSIDLITMKSRVKTNNVASRKQTGASTGDLIIDNKSFFKTTL